jgi:hypothetical protein
MLERAAALVGVTVHCTEVRAFHYKVIQEVIAVMSEAWLRCWYVARCAMEGEGCGRVHALLRLAGPTSRFLNLSSPSEEDAGVEEGSEAEWNGFNASSEAEVVADGLRDDGVMIADFRCDQREGEALASRYAWRD